MLITEYVGTEYGNKYVHSDSCYWVIQDSLWAFFKNDGPLNSCAVDSDQSRSRLPT